MKISHADLLVVAAERPLSTVVGGGCEILVVWDREPEGPPSELASSHMMFRFFKSCNEGVAVA